MAGEAQKRRVLGFWLTLVFAVALTGGSAVAAPGEVTVFPLAPGSAALGITSGADGNLWFTDPGTDRVVRITPTGQMTGFSGSPSSFILDFSNGTQGIAASSDGGFWFTAQGKIAHITTEGQVNALIPTPSQYLGGIAIGPEGAVWYADRQRRAIGRLSPSGQITEFHVAGQPLAITVGPDGNLWSTVAGDAASIETVGGMIVRITPTGKLTEFPLADDVGEPRGITSGPDGNLWFTAHVLRLSFTSEGAVGRITPQGEIKVFPLPGDLNDPQAITSGVDGHLWFTAPEYGIRFNGPGGIGAITPSGKITDFHNAGKRVALGIASGPEGNLWFTGQEWSFYYPYSLVGRITSGLVDISITSRRAVLSRHWVRLALECAGSTEVVCRGRLRLRAGDGRRLASRRYALPSDAARKVALRLSGKALEELSNRHRLKVKATITLNGGTGETRQILLQQKR